MSELTNDLTLEKLKHEIADMERMNSSLFDDELPLLRQLLATMQENERLLHLLKTHGIGYDNGK